MPLTVLNVAYPFAPVGPNAVGGAEQVLAQLDRELARAGENSVVLACAGSKTCGRLYEFPAPAGSLNAGMRSAAHRTYQRLLEEILERERPDVVHLHGIDFDRYLPSTRLTQLPVLVTLHLPLEWYPPEAFAHKGRRIYFNCVSASQFNRGFGLPGNVDVIANGVAVEQFATRHPIRKRSFATALGRICPEKGFHLALDAAREAGTPLLLAGKVFEFPEHRAYFEGEVRPRLDQARRFIGPVGFNAKKRLLSSARCLLVPSLVAETSSLVAMEALACGTPVIAFPTGALPEIIEEGVTGFLVTTEREMARAIRHADELSPGACREHARERFSLDRTGAAYLALYRRIVDAEKIQFLPRGDLAAAQMTGAFA